MSFIEIDLKTPKSDVDTDVLVAIMSLHPFNGFEQYEGGVLAYIATSEYNDEVESTLEKLQTDFGCRLHRKQIADQNWNALWESDYEPVMVDDFCIIRASFHPKTSGFLHEIIITPKMSFGTGHHATTHMMIQQMQGADWAGKRVLDYGCGTGVLAILASMLGAKEVLAVDIDTWAYNNTLENLGLNGVDNVSVQQGDLSVADGNYGIILANINRNVILDTLGEVAERLEEGGQLISSGFLRKDVSLVSEKAKSFGLAPKKIMNMEQWNCIFFEKNAL